VAQKGTKKDEANERSVDLDSLEPALRDKALALGFKKRASVNKVVRTIEHEQTYHKMAWIFVGVMALAGVVFLGLRYVIDPDRKGQFLMIGLFALMWSFLSWLFARRTKKHIVYSEELLAVVKDKLGK
jgi:hypothetical protein